MMGWPMQEPSSKPRKPVVIPNPPAMALKHYVKDRPQKLNAVETVSKLYGLPGGAAMVVKNVNGSSYAHNGKRNSKKQPECDLECGFDPGFWDEVAGFCKFRP